MDVKYLHSFPFVRLFYILSLLNIHPTFALPAPMSLLNMLNETKIEGMKTHSNQTHTHTHTPQSTLIPVHTLKHIEIEKECAKKTNLTCQTGKHKGTHTCAVLG